MLAYFTMSSSSTFSPEKQLFIDLSYRLTRQDSERIVYSEGLPEELGDKEPLRVLKYLQRCGQATEKARIPKRKVRVQVLPRALKLKVKVQMPRPRVAERVRL